MKRTVSKKERGKKHLIKPKNPKGMCSQCSKKLIKSKNIFFVEEEVGRIFCSEACIAKYFSPEIERLEKEYFQYLAPNDLSNQEREKLAHLRWMTLQEPDEIWMEKTQNGDHRFTLISEFRPGRKKIWCICICLFLKGEPSFLYLSFPTSNSAMAGLYRKGKRVIRQTENQSGSTQIPSNPTDSLADAWTEDETLRASLKKERRANDIPIEEFSRYEACLETTLKNPDEVWSIRLKQPKKAPLLYHFIRYYPDKEPGVWFLVIARETQDQEQIEILDAFPTLDPELVDCYRQGTQEVGHASTMGKSRTIH